MQEQSTLDKIDVEELVSLAAIDPELYARTFFPKTVRQASPYFHREMYAALDDPNSPNVAFRVFRGGAKTTTLRIALSKRIAYGITRTALYASNSLGGSVSSLQWIKSQVEHNYQWAQTFKLKKGRTWREDKIEIFHGIDEIPITVLALGITGQVRGVNFEDYRPDFIVADDLDNEETAGTPEQRNKQQDLFFGALAHTLAPRTEAPLAKLAVAQTPIAFGDIIDTCAKSPIWKVSTYGCFDENGNSRWPERFLTSDLRAQKEEAIRLLRHDIWLREMECTLISPELSAFNVSWLQYWDVLPEGMVTYMGIDPASSESKTADFMAIVIVGFYAGKVFLCDYYAAKGKNPEEISSKFFELAAQWKPRFCVVETVGFQRTLKWFIEREMHTRNFYVPIRGYDDRRKKWDRIRQAISGRAANRMFYVHKSHHEWIDQYTMYGLRPDLHDDLLDATAMAMSAVVPEAQGITINGEYSVVREQQALENWRTAP